MLLTHKTSPYFKLLSRSSKMLNLLVHHPGINQRSASDFIELLQLLSSLSITKWTRMISIQAWTNGLAKTQVSWMISQAITFSLTAQLKLQSTQHLRSCKTARAKFLSRIFSTRSQTLTIPKFKSQSNPEATMVRLDLTITPALFYRRPL